MIKHDPMTLHMHHACSKLIHLVADFLGKVTLLKEAARCTYLRPEPARLSEQSKHGFFYGGIDALQYQEDMPLNEKE